MSLKTYITIGDGVLMFALMVVAGVLFFLMPGWVLSGSTEVEIRSNDRVAGRYSLDTDRVVEVSGPLGKSIVEIKDGRARILSSPCPHKLCIRMGQIGKEGGVLVCVPNKIVVSVGNQRSDGLDAVSR